MRISDWSSDVCSSDLAGATIPANDKEAALDRLPRYDVDAWGVSSTMNWDGGPVTVRSITALRKSKVVQALDVDSTDLFLRDIEFYERSRSFTQEFQDRQSAV